MLALLVCEFMVHMVAEQTVVVARFVFLRYGFVLYVIAYLLLILPSGCGMPGSVCGASNATCAIQGFLLHFLYIGEPRSCSAS